MENQRQKFGQKLFLHRFFFSSCLQSFGREKDKWLMPHLQKFEKLPFQRKNNKEKKFFFLLCSFFSQQSWHKVPEMVNVIALNRHGDFCQSLRSSKMKKEKQIFFWQLGGFFKILISVLPTGPLNGRKTGACQNYRNWTALVLFFFFLLFFVYICLKSNKIVKLFLLFLLPTMLAQFNQKTTFITLNRARWFLSKV